MSSRAAYRAWETMRQDDDRVVVNIPADLQPLWRRVGRGIAGGTAHARFQNFMRYAEEHPREVTAALESDADAKVIAMLRSQVPEHERRRDAARRAVQTRKRRAK